MPDESEPLQSLIADIIDAECRGDPVDREALLRQHPEHTKSLCEFFANHDSMKARSNLEDVTLPPSSLSLAEEATERPRKVEPEEEVTLPANTSATGFTPTIGNKVRYFGDYELLEEIARGGMGVVYRARQVNLNRIVALKMILAGQLAGEEEVKRFYTEAEAAANLDHPSIVPIFEVGQHQGRHYFSMGYIEGQSLAQKVAGGPLPPRTAAELVRKICEAMAYAHERSVIHRDLKPANILLDQNGQPKVTDFGLAKQMNVDSGLTGTGQILGTPSYMAPEQANGKVEEVGPLADVYALGAILYCLLTGRPPFQAANPMDTLLQVLEKEPVAPFVLNNQVPKDLETICLKSLEKDPRNRYSSAVALSEELARFINDEPILARPISKPARVWRWCRRKPVLAGMGVSIIILLLLFAIGGPLVAVQQAALNRAALKANRDRARAQVEALLTANPQAVPVILQNMYAEYDELVPHLQILFESQEITDPQRIRLSLALLRSDKSQLEFLTQHLTTFDVEELLLIRQLLEPYADLLTKDLWQISLDTKKQPSERFRAACSLALYDPSNRHWEEIANDVVTRLVAESSLTAGRWVEAFQPARDQLLGPLTRVFEDRSDEQTAHRILATSILADYAAERPDVLTRLIVKSDSQQFLVLYPQVEAHAKAAILLIDHLKRATQQSDDPDEPAVLSLAIGAVALVRLGKEDLVWPLLKDSRDQRIRSYLIDRFASHGVPIDRITSGLSQTEDASIRQALILSLSMYSKTAFTASERNSLVETTTEAFRNDPDSGVHASCELLLRKLEVSEEIAGNERPHARARSSAGWFVNSQNQTFAVLTGKEFTMGSPEHEFGRRSDERQHQRIVPRRFAISFTEVTVEEFQRFLSARREIAHTYSRQLSPQSNCPQTSVTWYEAAAYCNWLSEQDGIPQHEWAFIANSNGKYASGMSLSTDYLERLGYRLPTEAEWEFACRSGSSNTRHYGNSDTLLGEYAWFLSNALDRSWPVGSKLPNRFGLFDTHGNVWEWCAEMPSPYPIGELPSYDQFEDVEMIEDGHPRVLRGGSYFYHSIYTRSSLRNQEPVDARYYGIGVRPVRTIR